jgi:hypothetical protein
LTEHLAVRRMLISSIWRPQAVLYYVQTIPRFVSGSKDLT